VYSLTVSLFNQGLLYIENRLKYKNIGKTETDLYAKVSFLSMFIGLRLT
jgi:hypothetical protein